MSTRGKRKTDDKFIIIKALIKQKFSMRHVESFFLKPSKHSSDTNKVFLWVVSGKKNEMLRRKSLLEVANEKEMIHYFKDEIEQVVEKKGLIEMERPYAIVCIDGVYDILRMSEIVQVIKHRLTKINSIHMLEPGFVSYQFANQHTGEDHHTHSHLPKKSPHKLLEGLQAKLKSPQSGGNQNYNPLKFQLEKFLAKSAIKEVKFVKRKPRDEGKVDKSFYYYVLGYTLEAQKEYFLVVKRSQEDEEVTSKGKLIFLSGIFYNSWFFVCRDQR